MHLSKTITLFAFTLLLLCYGCNSGDEQKLIQDINGLHEPTPGEIWLSHEHILVDFIGADSIDITAWNPDSVMKEVLPFVGGVKKYGVTYFVDATPNYLGRDVLLLKKISDQTGIKIITNTGLYGARNNKFIPQYAYDMTYEELAAMWIGEFENGIAGSGIKPGFIKIAVDNADTLQLMHQKLVAAAALTHLNTGLTIASHTGEASGLWPQLNILKEMGVSPASFIWVHAQSEADNAAYLKAAELGCWISLDGLGWEVDKYVEKLLFAKRNAILGQILISHDAGWYDPQKEEQSIQSYTAIFEKLFPKLRERGFTENELQQLISVNPAKAFAISVKARN